MKLIDKIKEGRYYKVLDKNHPFFGHACKVEGGKWHQGNLIGACLKNPLDTGSESFLFEEIEEVKKSK